VHELSIAHALVECVTEEAARRGADRVIAVSVRIGALSGVVSEALAFSFEVAALGTAAEGATLLIEDVPVTVFCPSCCVERTLPTIQDLRCPVCGAVTPDIREGRELEFTTMEIPNVDAHR
jgi:hydrogenase nickel incorporation protein HypA/HybF